MPDTAQVLRFRDCAVDLAARTVARDGVAQHLEPQAFDVLALLLENRDRVVPKVEILDAVWGGRFITDSALSTRIKEIRRATGDDGDAQSVVRTVRGRGYQFVAEVADAGRVTAGARRLVGRERDLEELLSRLQPGALVTLVGPGGVGKSALAREVVRQSAAASGNEPALVDLSVLTDGSEVVSAIARAVGMADDDAESLVAALGRRAGVVLLDDADDLVPEVAEFCAAVLRGDPAATIVVSCRERLGVGGERVWPVLPLAREAARRLLVDRAADAAPLARLDSSDALDELADSVDRLPLALEMLASMSALLEVAELQSLVLSGPSALTTGERSVPERHRSLAAVVEGALDRLDPHQVGALTALSAFAGAFTATDAAALLEPGASADAVDLLRQLADRSLLSPVDDGRGRRLQMLRTVRRAMLARTSPDDLARAQQRHGVFVLRCLEQADADLRGPDEARGAATFDRLADEARAAHAWARENDVPLAARMTRALHLYGYSRMWPEPATWAAALDGRTDDPFVSIALAAQAAQEGRLLEARTLANVGVGSADDGVRMAALEVLSDVAIYLHELEGATALSRELVDLAAQVGDRRQLAIGLTNLIIASTYLGDRLGAESAIAEADGLRIEALAPTDRAWLQFARGEALAVLDTGDPLPSFRSAVELADSVGAAFVGGVARCALAAEVADVDGASACVPYFVDVLATYLERGNVTHLTTALRLIVPPLVALDLDEAACVVGGWVLGPAARPGFASDLVRVRTSVDLVRERRGAAAVDAWMADGRSSTAPGVADRVLRELDRLP